MSIPSPTAPSPNVQIFGERRVVRKGVVFGPRLTADVLFLVDVTDGSDDPDVLPINGPHQLEHINAAIADVVQEYEASTHEFMEEFLVHGPYCFMVVNKGASFNSSKVEGPMQHQVKVELCMVRGPHVEVARPVDAPWTAERIAQVMSTTPAASFKAELDGAKAVDADMPFLAVGSMDHVPFTTPFPSLEIAVAGCRMDMENGTCYPLGVLENGTLHYWNWDTLLNPTRDQVITKSLTTCAELGLVVTAIGEELSNELD